MYVIYVCMPKMLSRRAHVPGRARARRPESEVAEVNTTCNQQMTTQKMEGAEMEGLDQCRGGEGEEARSANMIIASIFASFYS